MNKSGATPDGQWKWIAGFACFSTCFVLSGKYRSVGILVVAFLNEYNLSRKEASLPFTAYYVVVFLTAMNKSGATPDGQWKWIAGFACFSTCIVLGGINRSSGILVVAFLNEYNLSRKEASLPFTVCYVMVDFAGIIVGLLGHRYGIRSITIAGSLLGAAGLSLCYFTSNMSVITLCFGVFGCGFSFSYTLLHIIVNQYFPDSKAIMNGIVFSGSCFGSFLFPYLFEYLIFTYGFRGCLLLTGGIILQISVFGALMRPAVFIRSLQDVTKSQRYSDFLGKNGSEPDITHSKLLVESTDATQNEPQEIFDMTLYVLNQANGSDQLQDSNTLRLLVHDKLKQPNIIKMKNSHNAEIRSKALSEGNLLILKNDESCGNGSIFVKKHHFLKNVPNSLVTFVEPKSSHIYETRNNRETGFKDQKMKSSFDCSEFFEIDYEFAVHPYKTDQSAELKINSKFTSIQHGMERENDCSSDSLYSMKSLNSLSYEIPIIHERQKNPQRSDISASSHARNRKSLGAFKILKCLLVCPMFYVFSATNIIFYFNYQMYLIINVDYFLDKGIVSTDIKYIFFFFSSFDLFGRLGLGCITDRNIMKRSHFLLLTMAATAALYFSFPFAHEFIPLTSISSLYGLSLGSTLVILNIILLDYISVEMQEIAFGCISFMNGATTLLIVFLIEHFRDKMKSYSSIFFIMGLTSLFASMLWFFERYFVRVKSKVEVHRMS